MKKRQQEQAGYEAGVDRTKLLYDLVYTPFKDDWNRYRAVQIEQDAIFLKSVSALSAGAFGVSFAFINMLIPFHSADYKRVLAAGWILFAASIGLALLCHLASSFIHEKRCDDIKENIEEGYAGKPYTVRTRWYYGRLTTVLEISAFAGFLGGMGCLIFFVLLNL
jgi:hypothetical protein